MVRFGRGIEILGIYDERPQFQNKDAGEILASAVIDLMKKTDMPNGLSAVGYTETDVDALVEGTLPQHRVTKLCPRQFTPEDLKKIFLDSLTLW